MNDAGKVAFTPKGDYSSTVTYEYLDTVVYNGNAYAALKTTTGNAPTDSDTDENWKLLARGGESVPMASDTTPGVVKASSDIGVSDDGSMVLETDYTSQESLAELTSGESRTTFFGKIAKAVSTLISHVSLIASSSVRGHVKLSNSSSITVAGEYALDATEKNASVEGTLANQIGTINTNLTNLSTDFTSDKAALATHKNSSDHDGRYYTKTESNTLLGKKQDSILHGTYVSTNTADANGAITLGIDISSLGLSSKPKVAFLQGQNVGFYSIEKYVYAYDQSTKSLAVFVVSYGSNAANQSITDRYGYTVLP